jgi:transaldolase/glucose-6-phosphate isomerase
MTDSLPQQELRLSKYQLRVDVRLDEWKKEQFAERLIAKDPTLWPGSEDEIRDRLGWLDLAEDGLILVPQLEDILRDSIFEGIRRVFVIGMGGSSLAPEVFERTFGEADVGFVCVADSTHPDAVRNWIDQIDSDQFLFIVSSKSGSTLEMRVLFQVFWHALERWHSQPGLRFIAITDSGSELEGLANEKGFQRVFSSPADVGGRFSALSAFGLVPAALSGVDVERLLGAARDMQAACSLEDSPGVELGAALGELALAGRDKLTFLVSPVVASFPNWIEQLVAESLGKDGKGIVPVVDELPGAPEIYGDDRVFVGIVMEGEEDGISEQLRQLESQGHPVVEIRLWDRHDLGAEIVRWEVAVAAAAAVLKVQPFDQPDVERTKAFTRTALAGDGDEVDGAPQIIDGREGIKMRPELADWLASIQPGDYVVVQAFLAPDPELDQSLRSLQAALRDKTGCAVTCGYGPRFLHSTGQLHKGGANRGVFLQLLDQPGSDLLVPEHQYSFASVIAAQAAGDAAALVEGERRLLRIRLSTKPAALVLRLRDLVVG